MPAMGDSVSEGTVLEWHKQEGDQVSEDEVLVEISTDKVDAEVPAPTAGTVVKIHAAEGDTISVGAVLAEIAPGDERREARRRRGAEPPRPAGETVDIVMPAMGESVSEGTILEWAKQPGEPVAEDETIVEISTDKVDAEVPAPASGTIEEILAQAGDTVTVGQVIARMTTGNGAAPAAKAPEPTARAAAPGQRAGADAGRRQGHAGGRPRGRRARRRPREGPGLRARRPHLQGRRAGRRERRAGRRRGQAAQGRQRDARALHGRVAVDPDRDLVPHDHRHHARRPPQAAQGGRPARLLHPPDRLRGRPRGHRADAGDGARLPGDRRQAARARRRRRQPRHRRRRRAQGRRPHADGAGHPRRRAALVPRVPRRLQRPDHARARQHADRGRPPGRQRLAHQPGRHRHDRLRPAADERPGHDRRHRRDRLSRRASAQRARSAPRR